MLFKDNFLSILDILQFVFIFQGGEAGEALKVFREEGRIGEV